MKKFLLDTHVWLWLGPCPERIPEAVLGLLEDPAHALFLSAASSWEISIKYRLGKLPLPNKPERFIGLHHTVAVADLPDHHSDPFDRLLVAQAQIENMILVTADERLLPCQVEKVKV